MGCTYHGDNPTHTSTKDHKALGQRGLANNRGRSMVVFLLLVIVAILLFGAGAVTGAIASLGRLGMMLLVGAIILGIVQKVPAWCWWTLAGVVLVPMVGLMIFAMVQDDAPKARKPANGYTPRPGASQGEIDDVNAHYDRLRRQHLNDK